MATTNDGTGIKTGITDDLVLGSMKNRELIRDTYVGYVAKGAKIERGMLCFYNNGWKPTTNNERKVGTVRVAEGSVDNTDGELGDKVISTWGGGTIVVVKVGNTSRTNTIRSLKAGEGFTCGAEGKITSLLFRDDTADIPLGVVLGKVTEVDEHDVEAYGKNLVDGDLALVRLF